MIRLKNDYMKNSSATRYADAAWDAALGAALCCVGAALAALPLAAYLSPRHHAAWRARGRDWGAALALAAQRCLFRAPVIMAAFGPPCCCLGAGVMLAQEGLHRMGVSDGGAAMLWASFVDAAGGVWSSVAWVVFVFKLFAPIAFFFKTLHTLKVIEDSMKPNPRKDVVLVQVHFLPPVTSTTSVALDQRDSFAYTGPIQFPKVHSMPVAVPKFRKLLSRARERKNALVGRFPNLQLLGTEANHSQSQIWAWLHDHISNVVRDTHAVVHAACGLKVRRYVFVACITYDKNAASPKMRMFVLSKKQLKFIYDHPEFPNKDTTVWGRHTDQRARLAQLREFADHVNNTGGFLPPGHPKCKHKDEWMAVGKPRYWTKFEVCRPDFSS